MRKAFSFYMALLLILTGIVAYALGYLNTIFNGDTIIYHIVRELDYRPIVRFGWLILLLVAWVMLVWEREKGRFWIRTVLLIVASAFIIPVYTHIIVIEYQMENRAVDISLSSVERRMEFAVLEKVQYDEETKQYRLVLNYGTEKNDIVAKYVEPGETLDDQLEHNMKQRLDWDAQIFINKIWQRSHKPEEILFTIKWGDEKLFTSSAHRRDRFLSYHDDDESDAYHRTKQAPYYHFDFEQTEEGVFLKVLTDEGGWKKVTVPPSPSES